MRRTASGEPLHDMYACNYASQEKYCINSCGTQVHDGDEAVVTRPEGRQDYHLLFITDGNATATINESTYILQPGDLLFYRPFEPQHYTFTKGRCSSFWIHVSGTDVEELCNMSGLASGNLFRLSSLTEIERTHMKLIVENQSKQKGYNLFIQSYIELIFAQI